MLLEFWRDGNLKKSTSGFLGMEPESELLELISLLCLISILL